MVNLNKVLGLHMYKKYVSISSLLFLIKHVHPQSNYKGKVHMLNHLKIN